MADIIRDFVNGRYFKPARENGRTEVEVRAGDAHSEMSHKQRMHAVCAALGSYEIEHEFHVARTAVRGPSNGANPISFSRLNSN